MVDGLKGPAGLRRWLQAVFVCALVLPGLAAAQDASLEVLSYTNGATISIDGEVIAATPMLEPHFLPAGTHLVRVEKQGFLPFEEEITFEDDDEIVIEVDLLPFGGIVRVVTSEPGALVLVDNEEVGVTPYEGEVPVGERVFTVQRELYEDWVMTQVIVAGEQYLLEADMIALPDTGTVTIVTETTPFYRQWWFWSGAAVVIGGGIAAAILLSEDEEAAPVDILISLP